MQNTFAGMKPYWAVWKPIAQINPLFIAARIHPFQERLPTRIVEPIVSTHDK
jgi:hypothetical protein